MEEDQQQQEEEQEQEQEEEAPPSVVIDNGSGYCKAGFSGKEFPTSIFPAMIGRPKIKNYMDNNSNDNEFYVGAPPEEQKGKLNYTYPIENGVINNWDDMEKVWEHCYKNELKVKSEDYNCLLSEGPLNPKENREKMCELMFEKFKVPGLFISIQAILSLYSAGKFTGIVCDSGDGITQFVPIYDGYSLPHAIIRMDFAGRELTAFLTQILIEAGMRFSTSAGFEIVKDIKEKLCYVASDYEEELKTVKEEEYTLPDGSVIQIGEQRITCPESFFKPELFDRELGGIDKKCYDSILKCEIDLRRSLYECIILTGGSSMFKGLPERFEKEIKKRVPESMKKVIEVIATPERKYGVWNGGSVLASITSFGENWITREEYDEVGPAIANQRVN